MTVQNNISKNIYIGNASNKIFPYSFQLNTNHPEYVKVYITDSEGNTSETTNFSINTGTQEITYPTTGDALRAGYKITITRQLPLQQLLNLINGGAYFAEDIETALDDLVCMLQQQEENISRALVLPVSTSSTLSTSLPSPVPLHCFRWSADGKKLETTLDPATTLENVTALAKSASESKLAAALSEKNAKTSEDNAKESADNVRAIKDEALASIGTAKTEALHSLDATYAVALNNINEQTAVALIALENKRQTSLSDLEASKASAEEALDGYQTAAAAEADRAKKEADRAAAIAGIDTMTNPVIDSILGETFEGGNIGEIINQEEITTNEIDNLLTQQ